MQVYKLSLFTILSILISSTVMAQENQRGSWMPDIKQTDDFRDINNFLKSLQGSFRPMVVRYDGTVVASKSAFNNGEAELGNSTWSCSVERRKAGRDALDLNIDFKINKGELRSGGVAAAFDFTDWDRENYVLIPAYVYNGNRFNVETNGYMADYPEYYFYNKDVPGQLFSNSPRLAFIENTPGKIEGLAGNAATPAMCFYSPSKKRAFIMLFEQRSRFGDLGIFIEENKAQDEASFVISAPGVRELRAGFGDFYPSGDTGADWKAGDELGMKLRIYSFPANNIPDLWEKFMTVRKYLTGPNNPRNLTPFSTTVALTADRKNEYRWKETPAESFYRNENSDGYQVGWVGGLMDTYAMLAIDDPVSRDRVLATFDFAIKKMHNSESGYFHGTYRDGKLLSDRPGNIPDAALVRKNSDVLFWMVKQFELLRLQGYGDRIKPEWEKAINELAWAFVRTWEKFGELGNYVNVHTGDIIIYNTTSGAVAPAGLVMAGRYYDEPKFLETAKQVAEFMYERDVAGLGFTSAHSGDIMQDADADSAYGFVESLMALYYETGDKQWLKMAQDVANLGATWTLSHDYVFPANSTIGKLNSNTAGAVWASVQNKHAAPGVCTASADYLFKLYRATGDRRYAELLRDISHAHTEVMETPGRVTTGMGQGTSMERIQTTDADGKGAVGLIIATSNGWTEGNGMLMGIEIPGIYIRTDKDEMYVFDHAEVRSIKRGKSEITLEITNPTRFDASISVFAESSREARKPIGYHNFLNWEKVDVKSGETVTLTLNI